MLSSEMTAAIKSQQRVATILWLAMAASVLIYGLLLFLMQQQGILKEVAANNPEAYARLSLYLSPVALVLAVINVLAGRWLLSCHRIRGSLGKPASPEALARKKGGVVNTGRLTMLKSLAPEELRLFALMSDYFVSMLVRLALAEGITIIGFILALFGGDPAIILPFAVSTLLLMLFAFPRMGAHVERGQRELLLVPQR